MRKTVAFTTLGCKLNFAETSTIARMMSERGYEQVKFTEKADIYIINTCSVTEIADKKSNQMIRKAIHLSPEALIVAIGCFAQLKPHEIIEIEGVDIVLGTKDKFKLIEHIENFDLRHDAKITSCNIDDVREFSPAFSSGQRTRSFLKIQDGCNYCCNYCTIPLARGSSRSASISSIIEQVREITSLGIKEIVLTGVNIGTFHTESHQNFFNLIEELERIDKVVRFRISSIEPNLLSDEIIELVAKSNKFLPHFHIPLQSGNNRILNLMGRRYKKEFFENRVKKIQLHIPNAFIGIDLITGFPTETNDDFLETYEFLEQLRVSFLHIFSYSDRQNTQSVNLLPKVSSQDKNKRSMLLHQLCEKLHLDFYHKFENTSEEVLFEHTISDGKMFGFTRNYIKVSAEADEHFINQIVAVKLLSTIKNGLMACEIDPKSE